MQWTLITVVGPVLFAIVALWAIAHNRQTRAERQRTEDATRMRRAEEDADMKEKRD